jgi:predicted acyltransferase
MNIHTILAPWRATAAAVLLIAAAIALMAAPRPATSATVTYTGAGCTSFVVTGTPTNQTVTCSGGISKGVPVCAPTASPVAPAAGTTTTISANCSNQPTANTYIWTGGPCTLQSGPTCTVGKSRATSVSYTVQASNGSGLGAAAAITVTWH